MIVFDASALLAFLQGEPGAEQVQEALHGTAGCSAANWSEVAQRVRSVDGDWRMARSLLLSYDLAVESVTMADAEHAARAWRPGSGLSLADRLCLALADRLDAVAWTADREWGDDDRVHQLR